MGLDECKLDDRTRAYKKHLHNPRFTRGLWCILEVLMLGSYECDEPR